jgi:hypothetical protein
MDSVGEDQHEYAKVLYIIFAIIAFIIFSIQVTHLLKMQILPIYLQPFLSFILCYENILLFTGDNTTKHSTSANIGYFLYSCMIPIFIIIIFEVTLRLHEVRCAHFWGIPFEQGPEITYIPAFICIWLIRVLAIGLFIMNIIATYRLLHSQHVLAGDGGYAVLDEYPRSRHIWLSLIPSIILSIVGYMMGIALYRYGKQFTLSPRSDILSWSVLLVTVVLQMIGQCFNASVYSVTSNAGNICLLIGVSWMVHKVQRDLILAGTFADFLHTSNLVYKMTLEKARTNTTSAATSRGPADQGPQPGLQTRTISHYAMSMTRTASTRFAQIFSSSAEGTALPMETEMVTPRNSGSGASLAGIAMTMSMSNGIPIPRPAQLSSQSHGPGSGSLDNDHENVLSAGIGATKKVRHDPLNDEVVIITPRYELMLEHSHNGHSSIGIGSQNGSHNNSNHNGNHIGVNNSSHGSNHGGNHGSNHNSNNSSSNSMVTDPYISGRVTAVVASQGEI